MSYCSWQSLKSCHQRNLTVYLPMPPCRAKFLSIRWTFSSRKIFDSSFERLLSSKHEDDPRKALPGFLSLIVTDSTSVIVSTFRRHHYELIKIRDHVCSPACSDCSPVEDFLMIDDSLFFLVDGWKNKWKNEGLIFACLEISNFSCEFILNRFLSILLNLKPAPCEPKALQRHERHISPISSDYSEV